MKERETDVCQIEASQLKRETVVCQIDGQPSQFLLVFCFSAGLLLVEWLIWYEITLEKTVTEVIRTKCTDRS